MSAYFQPMTVRPILTAPDPRLQAVSTDVDAVTDEIRTLVDDMAESMYAADGIGLAAIQIGVPARVLVIDLDQKDGKKNPVAYINPKIVWASDEMAVFEEGCLSVPEIWDDVERPARIKCEYLDRDGKKQLLDRELLRMVGITAEAMRIIVVKSSNHFRADFTPIASSVLVAKVVEALGVTKSAAEVTL
jgi:peptide deformylase